MTREEKEKFFLDNMNLAYFALGKYKNSYGDYSENLKQIALMKLWECIDNYDSSKGEFSTYAVSTIKNYVKSHLLFNKWITRESGYLVYDTVRFIKKNADKNPNEIYEVLKEKRPSLKRYTFNAVYDSYINGMVYYDGITSNSGDDIDTYSLGFMVDESSDFYHKIDSDSFVNDVLNFIKRKLSKRDYDIFYKNVMEQASQSSLARHYGLSRMRICQIVNHGIRIGMVYMNIHNIRY